MNNNRIFIVDDEPDLTLDFKVGLEDNGFKIDAFNGLLSRIIVLEI